jgi:hypothetical protein
MKAMHSPRPTLSFFPDAPIGANMFGRYIVYHQLAGNPTVAHTKTLLFGHVARRGCEVFGFNIEAVKNALPEDVHFDVLQLMETATCFGIYSAALPAARKMKWQERIRTGEATRPNHFIPLPKGANYVKPHAHFCKECLDEDIKNYGVGYWRVVHQLPGVHQCPRHLSVLQGPCSQCMLPQCFEERWNTPSNHCPHCGNMAYIETEFQVTPIYRRFLSLCDGVVNGQSACLLPENRLQSYHQWGSSTTAQANESLSKRLIEHVLQTWNVNNLGEIASMLDIPLDERFISLACSGNDAIVNPLGHLVILASILPSLKTKMSLGEIEHPPERISTNLLNASLLNADDTVDSNDDIGRMALANGIPPALATELIQGTNLSLLRKKFGTSERRIEKFLDFLKQSGISVSTKKGRKGLPSKMDGSYAEEAREKYREQIKTAISQGCTHREEVKARKASAIKWCRKHDREWLDTTLPAIRPVNRKPQIPEAQKPSVYKKRLNSYIRSHPETTRSQLDVVIRTEFRWLFKHDRSWINSIIPAQVFPKRFASRC